ncbi:DUF6638 family protein [Roseibium sediminis]|uniref:DUF6638 family protein n=1 Tax=Roseibium sediminis TaxID=1775174 RepID=UPI00123CBD10|nr:DUF6638 family protein [Roseibium sediminis]
MMRLVKNGLMYGNLYEVSSPAMVERYNRAMYQLIGRRTELTEFHIDISGFSPEIGDELDDIYYLNPNGSNRQFILLSPEQKKAPLLNARFSTSRTIIRSYFDQNEEQLFALTARDAVVGELVNSVLVVKEPKDLFYIRDIVVEADTLGGHAEASDELAGKIDRFMSEDDAWWDDLLISDMITLARQTGDIVRSPIKLTPQSCTQKNFYTSHFGGLYIFQDVSQPACISVWSNKPGDDIPVNESFNLTDPESVAAFLSVNGLVETLTAKWVPNAQSIIKQKLDFIAIDTAANEGEDLSYVSRRDLRNLMRKYHDKMPAEYHSLRQVWLCLKAGGKLPKVPVTDPAYFYLLRAQNHADRDLVNMLLAQLTPLDFRQLFICHKDAFYAAYKTWHEQKKTYVAKFLAEEYMVDKVGTREELFGPEPAMDTDYVDLGLGRNVGPWGRIPRASDHDRYEDDEDDD